jgi:flagellum-specific peptidoglycan hydrolase FlgJ
MTKQQLLNTYYPSAVYATNGTGIFPQTLISQLILESGYNLSTLATTYNNFFGIKATPSWSGKVVSKNTTEYDSNNKPYTVYGLNWAYNSYNDAINSGANKMSLFRVYDTPTNGFKDYVSFLQNNPRYRNNGVFDATTPEQQFAALQRAGYATSQDYASELTDIYNSIKNYLPTVAAAGGGLLLLIALYFVLKK